MNFNRRLRAALIALLLTFLGTVNAHATVDRAICTTSDAGVTCSGAEVVTSANEEIGALDNRAPMDLVSVSGTNTYLASVTPTLTSYTGPQAFWLKVPNANTGAATLNINSIGAKALNNAAGGALAANDLVTTNIYLVRYYATGDEFRVVSPLGAGPASVGNAYVTIGNTAALTAERAITAGTAMGITDGGANSTVTINLTDVELTSVAGLTSAADKVPYYTGLGTAALADFSSAIRTLITTPSSANLRAMLSDELGTGVLFFLGAPASDDQLFVSTSTSAGAWGTLPDTDGAGLKLVYDQTTNAFSAGTDDDIPDAGDFTNLALSGDVVSSALVTTIQANSVALTTDTTGNYAAGDAEAGAALTGDSATAFFSAGSIEDARMTLKTESFCVAISDETTAITTGTAKATFRMPYAFTLTNIRGSLNTVSSSGSPIFDVNEGGTSVMTTNKVLIDVSELTSVTAVTAVTLTDTSLADDANMTVDIDTSGTGAKGAKVCLIGHQ